MRLLTHLLLFVIASTTAVRAQATPEALAQQYSAAIREGDFAGAARLMHPSALRQVRELFTPLLEGEFFDQVGPALLGVTSRTELSQMADSTLFAALLRNGVAQQAGGRELLKTATTTVIGAVAVGADTAYVVTRVEVNYEGIAISQYDVMAVVRDAGVWRGLLKADLSNMAALLRAALQRGGTPPAAS